MERRPRKVLVLGGQKLGKEHRGTGAQRETGRERERERERERDRVRGRETLTFKTLYLKTLKKKRYFSPVEHKPPKVIN